MVNKINNCISKSIYNKLIRDSCLISESGVDINYFDTYDLKLFKKSLSFSLEKSFKKAHIFLRNNTSDNYIGKLEIPYEKYKHEEIVSYIFNHKMGKLLEINGINSNNIVNIGNITSIIKDMSLDDFRFKLIENTFFGHKDWEIIYEFYEPKQIIIFNYYSDMFGIGRNSTELESKYIRFVNRFLRMLLDNRL